MTTITTHAIRVSQPLGDFYVFSLDAVTLNKITYSQPATIIQKLESESADEDGYSIFGSQRVEKKNRLLQIANFIESTEATFPNAIILAANYDDQGYFIEESSPRRWKAKQIKDNCYELTIPDSGEESASIIDGQHRLHAFMRLPDKSPHKQMPLLCAAFLDLPTPYHAYVFATINFNQRKVDRGLAYELFGFDVDEKPSEFWPPETLAVYLARVLNTSKGSPLENCIASPAIAAELIDKEPLQEKNEAEASEEKFKKPIVSMATVVDGILSLISKKPKEDRYLMRRPENLKLGRTCLPPSTDLPLRTFYLQNNDLAIKEVISNYFSAIGETIWKEAEPNSYLMKTVGVQASFDVLKKILQNRPINAKSYSPSALEDLFTGFKSSRDYQASGIGRSDIRKDLLSHLHLS